MARLTALLLFTGLLVGVAGAQAQSQSSPSQAPQEPDAAEQLGLDLRSPRSVASNSQFVEQSQAEFVRDYLVPLGAMQKVRGVWSARDSLRLSGEKTTYTFRMEAGFDVAELSSALQAELEQLGASKSFSCEARACGSSVQWANRIFKERILYGTEKSQRYAVLNIDRGEHRHLIQLYSSARSSDRQYLHLVIISYSG